VLRDAVRRPLVFLDADLFGEVDRPGELEGPELEGPELDGREEGRLVDPDREGLDRLTLEPLWAERPPPPRDPPPPPRWAA
jgi:hypothetical protein